MGHKLTAVEIADLFKRIDSDGNGEIEFDEFLSMMSQMETMKQPARGAGQEEDEDVNAMVKRHLLFAHERNKRRQKSKEAGRAAGLRHCQLGDGVCLHVIIGIVCMSPACFNHSLFFELETATNLSSMRNPSRRKS